MKLKYLFRFFAVIVPLAIIARVYQITMSDPATGFYKPAYASIDMLIMVALYIIIVLFIAGGRMSRKHPKALGTQSTYMAIASFVMAAATFVFFLTTMLSATELKSIDYFYGITILGSAFYFTWQGLGFLELVNLSTILSVFPILMAAIRLGTTFVKFTGISLISENLIDIIMLSLTLLFWLFHGRIFSGISFRKSIKWVFGIGLSASLICVSATIPRYFIYLVYGSEKLHQASIPYFIDVVVAAYIVCFLLFSFKKVKEAPVIVTEPTEDDLVLKMD